MRTIKPLGGQDGGPPPQSAPILFERQYTLYAPELTLLSETAPTSSTTSTPPIAYDYIWFGSQPLAQIENATGNIAWYFNDHLGTPIRQTDASGHLIWDAEYEPYGTIYAIRRGESRHQPLRLPGQTAEEGSDLYQNVFRYYRAGWGRYTQADPLGAAGGINLFAYVDENPVRFFDPLGLISPVKPKDQKWRLCNNTELAQCQASCRYGMESCRVSQTFRVIRAKNGMTVRGWVDGPMSCSCKEPSCWDKAKDWARRWTNDPTPLPPILPLPPFEIPTPEPVVPGLPPFFINPCMMNPTLCSGPGGSA